MTGSVTKIEKFSPPEKDEKLSSIEEIKNPNHEVKTVQSNQTEEEKLIDILDDVAPDHVGSLASVKVIEVKEAPVPSENASPKSDVNPHRLSVLTSPVEQVLIEKITVDGTIESSSPKSSDLMEDVPDLVDATSTDIADIMTLEEVLNNELLNLSASGLCWQLSRDKKNVLCMFFVK